MDLPFVVLDVVWHIGELADPPQPRGIKSWDYEFGLLSVSLEPDAWRANWAGDSGEIFELQRPDRTLRFIDADLALLSLRAEIARAAEALGLIDDPSAGVSPTSLLYECLGLTESSQLHLNNRPFEDQVLQAALAVLASADATIDGLWWKDLLNGEMRTERGGIFQHRLSEVRASIVLPPAVRSSPEAVWVLSTILD